MKLFHGGRVQAESTRAPEALDILVGDDGRIEALLAPGAAAPGAERIDLANRLVVPGLLDAHQHLDKSRTLRDVPNPAGDLDGAIAALSSPCRPHDPGRGRTQCRAHDRGLLERGRWPSARM
jgi:cytosine deaminase